MDYLQPLQVIWDYLCLKEPLQKADCIVGFGNFNTDIARRAAELYHAGYAPKILFTGGLGRNTEGLLPEPEAVRFAKVAMECGVPEEDIILEDKSRNTKENIEFTRKLLEELGIPSLLNSYTLIAIYPDDGRWVQANASQQEWSLAGSSLFGRSALLSGP